MLNCGVPEQAVKNKMRLDKIEPNILDNYKKLKSNNSTNNCINNLTNNYSNNSNDNSINNSINNSMKALIKNNGLFSSNLLSDLKNPKLKLKSVNLKKNKKPKIYNSSNPLISLTEIKSILGNLKKID